LILFFMALCFSWPLSWHLYESNRFVFHDLGLVNYFLDSTMNGYFMRSPLPEDYSHFAVHVHPTLMLLLPFKLIWPNSFVLIFGQIFLQALAIIPLYFFTKGLTRSKVLPWIVIGFFFSNKYVIEAFLSAHYEQLYLAPMLAVFAFLQRGKIRWAWVMLMLAFGVRDDYAFLTGMSAVTFAVFDSKNRRFWAQASVAGVAWFLAARAFIIPHMYNPNKVFANILMEHWGEYGKTIPQVIIYFITHPLWILNEVWSHSDYQRFLRSHDWISFFSPYGLGTLTPMSYLVTYKTTAGRLVYYFSCSMLPFSLAGYAWFLTKIHSWFGFIWRSGILLVAMISIGDHWKHNWSYTNPNEDVICFPWNCHSRYPLDENEDFANRTIDAYINTSNQPAAMTFRHFGRAKWHRELVLNSHALEFNSCWVFADQDEVKRFPFMETGELVQKLEARSDYELLAHQGPYFLFHRRDCSK
jgi:uncharacterized membrane protein